MGRNKLKKTLLQKKHRKIFLLIVIMSIASCFTYELAFNSRKARHEQTQWSHALKAITPSVFKQQAYIGKIQGENKRERSLRFEKLQKEFPQLNPSWLYSSQGLIHLQLSPFEKFLYADSLLSKKYSLSWLDRDRPLVPTSVFPADPDYQRQWGLNNLGAPMERNPLPGTPGVDIGMKEVWPLIQKLDEEDKAKNIAHDDIVVAIIDSGIQYNLPDFEGKIWKNIKELNGDPGVDDDGNGFIDDIYGWDFENNDNDPMDDHLHGTHIAGIIGAKINNNIGISGIAPHVKMMAVKWLDAGLLGSTSKAILAMHYAMDKGAKILNCSWGEDNEDDAGFYEPPAALLDAIHRAEKENILIVAAAGNGNYDLQYGKFFPASYDEPNLISVAAINNQGQLWTQPAYGSNFGRNDVDIAAPGEDIVSYTLKGLKPLSGTSMAAPFVSGVAALTWFYHPELTASELKQRLMASAVTTPYLRARLRSAGVINAKYALTGEPAPKDTLDPYYWSHIPYDLKAPKPSDNEVRTYTIQYPGAQKISAHIKQLYMPFGDHVLVMNKNGDVLAKLNGSIHGEYTPHAEGDTLIINVVGKENPHGGVGLIIDYIAVE